MNKELLLLNFINSVCVDAFEIEAQVKLYRDNLPKLAEAYKFSRFDVNFVGVPTPMNPEGIKYSYTLYESVDIDTSNPLIKNIETPEGGNVTFTIYALPDNPWTDEDKSSLDAILSLIYVALGRARIHSLLEAAVSMDQDTGLPNSHGFISLAKGIEADGLLEDYVLMFLNIKNFRIFAKREGAEASDLLIKDYFEEVHKICQKDEFCCRLGGDNGAVLVKKENYNEALFKLTEITVPLNKFGQIIRIHIDTWIGVYFVAANTSVNEAMGFASIALSSAKAGKGHGLISVFNDRMLENFSHNRDVLAEFPIALRKKEFKVYYQPKAQVNSQKLVGAEGLVRWVRRGKLVSPFEFIPVLEEDGMIVELDYYVLEQVCQDIRGWLDQGIEPVRISTNFSRHHFHTTNTAERIINMLEKYDIPGQYIQIEITEMSGYSNLETMLTFIRTLHEHGITVAIDDFGVGYSSINMLKDYNADIVKIDKSLLNDVEINFKARMLLENMIKMSQSVGMDVVIEGVETLNQLAYVSDIGCNLVQGYFFDKPLPKEEFLDRLQNKKYNID